MEGKEKRLYEKWKKAEREYYSYIGQKKADKEAACSHRWHFVGHYHDDDAYECRDCGKIRYD
jgi:hypothetical protein